MTLSEKLDKEMEIEILWGLYPEICEYVFGANPKPEKTFTKIEEGEIPF